MKSRKPWNERPEVGGESYNIPVRLDDYVLKEWKPNKSYLADALRSRVIADFRHTDGGSAKFQGSLEKLLRVLRKRPELPLSSTC